jgi:acyl-coenzyme A thioesterase PaaI-like protein
MRSGRKVAVVRTERHNEKEVLLAVGTGAYMAGEPPPVVVLSSG